MIKELSELFKTVVDSLSRHPFATLSTILISVVLYVGYITLERIETIAVPPSLEAERFHQQLDSSEQINQSLEKLRVAQGAHSVIVRQFHNGKHDLTGIPFTKSSITFYAMDNELEQMEEPLSSMSTSLSKVWAKIDEPDCILLDHGIDKNTKHYMDVYELNAVIICPMTNLLKYPVGTITVGYKNRDLLDLNEVRSVSSQVTGYLDGTSKN